MGWYAHGRGVPGKPFKFDPGTKLQQPHAFDHLLDTDSTDPNYLAHLEDLHAAAQTSQRQHEDRHQAALEKALTGIVAELGGETPWDVEVRGRAGNANAADEYVNGHLEVTFNQARLKD